MWCTVIWLGGDPKLLVLKMAPKTSNEGTAGKGMLYLEH